MSVNRIGEYEAYREPKTNALTDRQQEVLDVTQERGHYEIPRQTSLRKIAEEVEVRKAPLQTTYEKQRHGLCRASKTVRGPSDFLTRRERRDVLATAKRIHRVPVSRPRHYLKG